jgi:hypothetical protein
MRRTINLVITYLTSPIHTSVEYTGGDTTAGHH